MQRGLFIVVEGIDGTGKSTQTQRLAEHLRAQGREVVLSREPTDGPWGKKLRASGTGERLSAEEELELFLLDRRDHVEQLIQPALAAGKVVILDRYYFSTMAYQGARGFDPAVIRARNEAFAPQPDLLLLLDLPVEVALQRIGARNEGVTAFEQSDTLERCRAIYRSLIGESFVRVIDANAPAEEVTARMAEAVDSPTP